MMKRPPPPPPARADKPAREPARKVIRAFVRNLEKVASARSGSDRAHRPAKKDASE